MTRSPFSSGRAALVVSTGIAMMLALSALAAPGGQNAGPGAHMGHHGCGPVSRLTVGGSGVSRIAPDRAVIQMGVTSQADSAAEAMAQNGQQQGAVIDALKASGIAAEDIQTSGLNLSPVTDFSEGRAPKIIGYRASNMVSVRVTEVARLGEVLDAIVAVGANEINGISFEREDGQAAADDARRAAVEDARHKAGVLAGAAGLALGPVMVMRDVSMQGGPMPMPMMMQADMVRSASAPVEPGQLSVTAEVQIEYALIGAGDCGSRAGGGDDDGHGDGHGKAMQDGSTPADTGDAAETAPGSDLN